MERRAAQPRTHDARRAERTAAGARAVLRVLAACLPFVAATFILHLGSLHAPFYGDDLAFLDQVRGRSLPAALLSPDPLGNYFRPVSRQLHFWLLGHASGESPLVFHLASWGLWAVVVALLLDLLRRLAGARAAVVGAAFLALHYAADVPLLWASDSQDLLAVAGVLAALRLHLAGRRGWAALALALALLSKETVALAPAIAVVLDRRADEPWRAPLRRAWPLGLTVVAWLALWLAVAAGLPAGREPMVFEPAVPLAALAHLAQVALGIEWGAHGPGRPWQPAALVAALALALGAVWQAWGSGRSASAPGAPHAPARAPLLARDRAVRAGLAWAALGALPVSGAVHYWSAYVYLFALAGVALALGAWLSSRSRALALGVLAALAFSSALGRGLDEYAQEFQSWTPLSHINRYSLARGMGHNTHYLEMLLAARPRVPERSTLFFAGIPKAVPFQQGNGPLVRWAYRDSTLRSYYLTQFSLEKARRGPVLFFALVNDALTELPQTPDGLRRIALALLLDDAPTSARDLLELELERADDDLESHYWRALLEWRDGRRETAIAELRRAGIVPDAGPTPEIGAARASLAQRDSAQAIQILARGANLHGLDPAVHALLADLLLAQPEALDPGAIEALAARVLAPEDAAGWRRWGKRQFTGGRYDQARLSLERYLELGGSAACADAEVRALMAYLERILPGGDLARAGLRGDVHADR